MQNCPFCNTVITYAQACPNEDDNDLEVGRFTDTAVIGCPACGRQVEVTTMIETIVERSVLNVKPNLTRHDAAYLAWQAERTGADIKTLTAGHFSAITAAATAHQDDERQPTMAPAG